MWRGLLVGGVLALLSTVAVATPVSAHEPGQLAEYNGRVIDMSQGWGGAGACHVADSGAWCFDSETEMDEWLARTESPRSAVPAESAMSGGSCGGLLRLYDWTSYGGASLNLSLRSEWLDLADYGFDQRTSSFKIGPCSATFADWTGGGGGIYPTHLTQAHDQSTSMISGWNNDVSSVYIS